MKTVQMGIDWAIDALSAEWATVKAAPIVLCIALLLGLFLAWGGAWFILRRRLAYYKERLDDYRDQISKMQNGPIAAAADDLFDRSELRLLINGDEQVPTVLFFLNIWRWFLLRPGLDETGTGKRVEHDPISLVVVFDRPTKVGTLQVKPTPFCRVMKSRNSTTDLQLSCSPMRYPRVRWKSGRSSHRAFTRQRSRRLSAYSRRRNDPRYHETLKPALPA